MATSFSRAAQAGLTQGSLEGVRPSRTNLEALGEDFQTYEKIGEVGDSFGGKTIIYQVYDPFGNPIGQTSVQESGLEEGLKQAAALAAIPLTAGGAGAALGGALGLTGTAASALGNALISGGAGALTGQDPLKAALLAAGGTYAGSLFGGPSSATEATLTDAQFVAADAAQLAAQGLNPNQIEQVLRASGVNTVTAIAAADAASSGMNVDQIAKDITLGNRGLFSDTTATTTPTTVTTSPEGLQTVTTTAASPAVNAGGLLGGLTAAVPAAVNAGGNIISSSLPSVDQQVTITGDKAPASNLGNILATVDPSLIGPGVGPQLPVDQIITTTGTKATDTKNLPATITALDTVVSPGPDVGPQQIDVTGTKDKKTIGDVAAAVNAGTQFGPGMTGTQTTVYDKVLEKTDSKTAADTAATLAGGLTLADLLKAFTTLSSLGMLGGGGGGGGGGTTTMAPTTPVPVGNADYYKSIQQYYNTYMPQTPRDVATPLQQWYEGKFGG